MNRRNFLTHSALVSLTPLVPGFLSRSLAAEPASPDGRILVVLQLDGGNDGLNTVIPFANQDYEKARPQIKIPSNEVLKLNDEIGLHPAMKSIAKMYEEGRMTVIQGVGYPNPDRSHFRSMAIWHQGILEAQQNSGYGWLGKAVDSIKSSTSNHPDAVFVGNQTIPHALWGRRSQVISFNRESDMLLSKEVQSTIATTENTSSADDLDSYVSRVVDRSYQTANRFREQAQNKASSKADYPDTELAKQLSLISLMIKNEMAARVYYVSQMGYDTHSGQYAAHPNLLRSVSGALKAFFDDLASAKLDDRVALLVFSEFGRRVAENDSMGTDHGAAGPVFLAGPTTIGGIVGSHPSLTDLDDGDLKMNIDFRAIYASLLTEWMNVPADKVLPRQFSCPKLFKQTSSQS